MEWRAPSGAGLSSPAMKAEISLIHEAFVAWLALGRARRGVTQVETLREKDDMKEAQAFLGSGVMKEAYRPT